MAAPTNEEDAWVHRSKAMSCVTCMYYVPKKTIHARDGAALGRCRRKSPTLGGWPVMFENDWCGEHKLDEEKLGEIVF